MPGPKNEETVPNPAPSGIEKVEENQDNKEYESQEKKKETDEKSMEMNESTA